MSAFTSLPSVQATDNPLFNTSDPSELHIAHEILLLAVMKELAALPDGKQRLGNISQFCMSQLGERAGDEPSRIVSALIAAVQQSE